MTRQEIKTDLEQGTYMLNQNDQWALDFWKEAVEKCPELVVKEFKELNDSILSDDYMQDLYEGGFELNDTYKEMFKTLKLS